MPQEETLKRFAPLVLRLGLVGLFLSFGIWQILQPDAWFSWVPQWVPDITHMSLRLIVLLNGGLEVVLGTLLLLGIYVRWVAFILALHTLSIAYEIGFNDIGIRDASLAICCIAIALFGNDDWSLQRKFS